MTDTSAPPRRIGSLLSILLAVAMIALATKLLCSGILLSGDYVVLVLGSIVVCLAIHSFKLIKEIDIKGLKLVLREFKTERAEVDRSAEQLRQVASDLCEVSYSSLAGNVHERVRFGLEILRQIEVEEKRMQALERVFGAMTKLGKSATDVDALRQEMRESVVYKLKPILHEAIYRRYCDERSLLLSRMKTPKEREDFGQQEKTLTPYERLYAVTSGGPIDRAGVEKVFTDAGVSSKSAMALLSEVQAFFDRHTLRAVDAAISGQIPIGASR